MCCLEPLLAHAGTGSEQGDFCAGAQDPAGAQGLEGHILGPSELPQSFQGAAVGVWGV